MDADELAARTEVLADIGLALVHAQAAERIMRQTLLLVLPKASPVDLKAFVEADEMLEDRMFGQLLNILRSRADLEDNLAELLRTFRLDRNNLAHHLERIPGFDMSTPDGRTAARQWLGKLVRDADKIIHIFAALNLAWHRQVGFVTPLDDEVRKYFGDEDVEEIANMFFFAKE